MNRIPIIFTTYNGLDLTKRAYASLMANTEESERIEPVIVDASPGSSTRRWAKKQGIRVIKNPRPLNLASSWNMAMEKTDAPVVLLSNNDVEFLPGWDAILDEMHPQVGICLPREVAAEEEVDEDTFESEWARGFCFALRRDVYEEIGQFDEQFFTHEDTDFFHRVLRHYKILRKGSAQVIHIPGQTTKTLPYGKYDELFYKSRMRFYEKHGNWAKFGADGREIVSVIIPTHNRQAKLDLALKSVFSQSFESFKVYVVMDNCTDDDITWELVKAYEDRDSRIMGIRTEDHGLAGVADARNLGLSFADGKYVAFLDDDDVWYPYHLAESLGYHESHLVEMTYSMPDFAWRYHNSLKDCYHEVKDESPNIAYDGPFDRERLNAGNYIHTSSTVWWGPTIKALGFPSGVDFEEDWDTFKRCPDPVAKIGGRTVCYFWEEGGGHLTGKKVRELR